MRWEVSGCLVRHIKYVPIATAEELCRAGGCEWISVCVRIELKSDYRLKGGRDEINKPYGGGPVDEQDGLKT